MHTTTLFNAIGRAAMLCLGLALSSVPGARAQGAGNAVSFPATAANEHVNLTTGLSAALATSSFTIEMWVNFAALNADEPLIANKDWNNGANTGFALTRSSKQSSSNVNIITPITTNTFWFNIQTIGGTRHDWHFSLPALNLLNNWNHVAISVDRNGSVAFYINGLRATIAGYTQNGTNSWAPINMNIAADATRSLSGTLPVRIGQDGTGTYAPRYNGKMDEVRIWTNARTQAQIRETMCQKLGGNETGLLAYYRLDETSGTVATNSATATGATYNGTMTNGPARIASGAALGDTAVSLYPATFTGQTLAIASAANGTVTLQNMNNALKGMQLYRINSAPNTTTNIPNPGSNSNVHFGVFPVDTTSAGGSFDVVYNYSGFPDANTFERGIDLYRRFSVDSAWGIAGAVKSTTAKNVTLAATTRRKDLIIGNFFNVVTCNTPSAGLASGVGFNTATATWVSGGSNRWNLEYKAGSFTPGTGTRVSNLAATSYNFTGLNANTTYTFYVQDTCAGISSSSPWAGPYSFTTQQDLSALSSGYAMNFPGTAANEHVNLGTALSAAMATSNFTIETWINFSKFNNDEAFIANKNWNSGANTGFSWGLSNKSGMPESSLWFNIQPVGGTRRDWHITIPGLNLKNNWNHIAVAADRKGDIAFYINGVPARILQYYAGNSLQSAVSVTIAADSAKTLNGTLPVRIGQDGTGTYGVKFAGKMDETRIWNTVRSQTEIRDFMCRKLKGTETGLLSYYKMDEPAGTTTSNSAAATSSLYTGTLVNNPTRVLSGAAIGDTSIYMYGNGLAGRTITLPSPQNGSVIVDSLSGAYTGIQLYRLDTIPNTTFDIAATGNNKVYYGVFPVDTAASVNPDFAVPDASYRLNYNYSNYPSAVTNSGTINLYNRKAGDVMMWTSLGAAHVTASRQFTIAEQRKRKEVILGDFAAVACNVPAIMKADSVTDSYARVIWSSTAVKWNIQYGPSGFTLGQGTPDTINTTAKAALKGLSGDTWYDVYVRTRCGNDSSKWTGPLTFKTPDRCPAPSVLRGTHLGADSVKLVWNNTGAAVYNLQWGLQGFTFGTGIPVDHISGTSYVLNGLSATSVYEAYVQDTCSGGGTSKWYGPVTFVASGFVQPPTTVATIHGQAATFTAYPNPAKAELSIARMNTTGKDAATITMTNIQGIIVRRMSGVSFPYRMDVSDLTPGIYLLKCSAGGETNNIRIIIGQ